MVHRLVGFDECNLSDQPSLLTTTPPPPAHPLVGCRWFRGNIDPYVTRYRTILATIGYGFLP